MFDENTSSFAVPASELAFLAAKKRLAPGHIKANSSVDSCLPATFNLQRHIRFSVVRGLIKPAFRYEQRHAG
jgi:hypothetical protein